VRDRDAVDPRRRRVAPNGADAPAHRADPVLRLVEGVEVALVEDVGADGLDLPRVDEPDLVAVGSLDRSPAQQPRIARQRRRRRRRDDVEAERGAPRGRVRREERADARVERMRRAGDPRQRQRRRLDGGLQRVVVEDPVVAERVGRGELELVARRAGDRVPGERRRAVEGRRRGLVRAQEKAVQAGRRGKPCRGGMGARSQCGHSEKRRDTHESHSLVFGMRRPPAVPQMRDARSAPAARTAASRPGAPTS
jgi:hypothetical protein